MYNSIQISRKVQELWAFSLTDHNRWTDAEQTTKKVVSHASG